MKKIITLIISLFSVFQLSAQKAGDGKSTWGNWKAAAECFPNLYVSFRCEGWEVNTKSYWYNIRFKNTSNKVLHFNSDVTFQTTGEKFFAGSGRFDVGANKEYVHVSSSSNVKPNLNNKEFFGILITRYLETDGRDDWTVPSYSCNGRTPVCDQNCGKNGNNSSNSNNNSNTNNSSNNFNSSNLQSAIDRLNELCAIQIYSNDTRSANAHAKYCTGKTFDQTQASLDFVNAGIKELEAAHNAGESAADKAKKDAEDAAEKAKKAEEERIEKEKKMNEEKDTKINSLISEGDALLASKDFDGAIGKYNQAKSELGYFASMEYQKSYYDQQMQRIDALIAAAIKAQADAARQVRTDNFTTDRNNDVQEATQLVTTVAAAMVMLKDYRSYNKVAARGFLGLGYESVPIIMNSKQITLGPTYNKSRTSKTGQPSVYAGLRLNFFNQTAINFELAPELSYGYSLLDGNQTKGNILSYGGTATLSFGLKPHAPVKLFATGGYFSKTGDVSKDGDVGTGTSTDLVEDAIFEYKTIRYGGGIEFNILTNKEDAYTEHHEVTLKPGVYFDKFNFAKNVKPTMIFGLSVGYTKLLQLDFLYSQNYGISGLLLYPGNFDAANQNYMQVRLVKTQLFNSRVDPPQSKRKAKTEKKLKKLQY